MSEFIQLNAFWRTFFRKFEKGCCDSLRLSIERPSPERRRRGSGQILEVSEAGRAVLIRAHLVLFVSLVGFLAGHVF